MSRYFHAEGELRDTLELAAPTPAEHRGWLRALATKGAPLLDTLPASFARTEDLEADGAAGLRRAERQGDTSNLPEVAYAPWQRTGIYSNIATNPERFRTRSEWHAYRYIQQTWAV